MEKHLTSLAVTIPQPELDYSKIIISDGVLSRISGATAIKEDDTIKFSWSDTIEKIIGEPTDKVAMVVYNVNNSELSFTMGEVLRSAKTATLPVPYSETGDKLVFYLFFQSTTDLTLVSTSHYLGSITVE